MYALGSSGAEGGIKDEAKLLHRILPEYSIPDVDNWIQAAGGCRSKPKVKGKT